MNPTIQKDIQNVLKKAVEFLTKNKPFALSEMSNHTIHNASIFQDEDSISIAILIYSLSKIIQRCQEQCMPFTKGILLLKKAHDSLNKNNYDEYRNSIKSLFQEIKRIDARLQLFVEEVLLKARIKKGTKLHEHGLSTARIAELLGISQWDLLDYIGKTTVEEYDGMPVEERIKLARAIFRG